MRREVQFKLRTIRTSCTKSRVHRPTRVDDQQITSPEKIPNITEPRMRHAIIRAVRNHQPHLVPCQTSRFRRPTRPKLWRQIEVQHLSIRYTRIYKPERQRFCINHSYSHFCASARAAYLPLDRSPVINSINPGTLTSGNGRSLISSPGNASWCICVRISPGSTQYTRH